MRIRLEYIGKEDLIIDGRELVREIEMNSRYSAIFSLNPSARLSIKYDDEGDFTGKIHLIAKNKKDMGHLLNRCYQGKWNNWKFIGAGV